MTHEEKDRMLNKYKYGLDHGGRIMNDEEASKIRNNKIPLRAVLSEILNRKIIWYEIKNLTLFYTYGNGLTMSEKDNIEICKFQSLCKAWAKEKRCMLLSGVGYLTDYESAICQVHASGMPDITFVENTEYMAVINACEWIYNETK